MKTYREMHREARCEEINKKGRSRKALCSKICKEIKKGMSIPEGVIEGVEHPYEYEFYDGSKESFKTLPRIGYFGTVVVLEGNGQMTHYDPDSPRVLEAWVDASKSPLRIPLEYGQEFIPSEDGRGEYDGKNGFVISLFEEEEKETIAIGVGDSESVWREKNVSPSSLKRELKRLRLMLPILGDALLEKWFYSAEP